MVGVERWLRTMSSRPAHTGRMLQGGLGLLGQRPVRRRTEATGQQLSLGKDFVRSVEKVRSIALGGTYSSKPRRIKVLSSSHDVFQRNAGQFMRKCDAWEQQENYRLRKKIHLRCGCTGRL
jgi:hypothetical protein